MRITRCRPVWPALLAALSGIIAQGPLPAPVSWSAPPPSRATDGTPAVRSSAGASAARESAGVRGHAGGAAGDGRSLAARFECARCHDGTGLEPGAPDKHCVHCHQDIRAGRLQAPAELLARWRAHIVSLVEVPTLTATRQRLRRDWVERFLLEPHDLRPNLPATMPRLALSGDQARAIARWLVPEEAEAIDLSGADLTAGRRLLDSRGCGVCHTFTGVERIAPSPLSSSVDARHLERARVLAPDLRYTRDRFQPAALVRWLEHPSTVKSDTLMPDLPMTELEARDLAAYLLRTPLAPPPARAVPTRLPVLERPVSFDEVAGRVFYKTCRHCHADPDFAIGDGGVGNTGGFGFEGRGLNLANYAGLCSGSRDDRGEPRSLFAPLSDGTPRLLAPLLARQVEEAGGSVPGVRGMPLGLPALTPEDVQLVESWIAQGHPL